MPSALSDEELDRFLQEIGVRAKEPSLEKREEVRKEKQMQWDQLFARLYAAKVAKKQKRLSALKFFLSGFLLMILFAGVQFALHFPLYVEVKQMREQLAELQTQVSNIKIELPEIPVAIEEVIEPETPKEEIIEPVVPVVDNIR